MRVFTWKRKVLMMAVVASLTFLGSFVGILQMKQLHPLDEGQWSGVSVSDPRGKGQKWEVSAPVWVSRAGSSGHVAVREDVDLLPASLLIPRLAQYCNGPSDVIEGEEGEAPQGHTLQSVYVILRHGDSSPKNSVPDLQQPSHNCTMDRELLHAFPQLRHFLSDMETQRDHQRAGSDFAHWALYPQHANCGTSLLTGQGAMQQLLNGLALKDKYVHKWNLFGDQFSPSDQLRLHSTQQSSTYQSAVAFLYAFLPTFNITDLNVHVARDAVFCNSSIVPATCCTGLHKLQQKVDRERLKRRKLDRSGEPVLQALADVLDVKMSQLPEPKVLVDILQSYVCHSLPLPCGKGRRCVTAAMVSKLFQLVDSEMDGDGQDVTYDRYSRALTHSLLLDVLTNMLQVSRNQSLVKVTLFSGHDFTLTSVLQALGVQEGKQPRHAARLVMELYRKEGGKGGYHVRVVRDGRDVTSLVRFCRGRTKGGMCQLKDFDTYVSRDNMAVMGITDRQGLFSFCQSLASPRF